MVKPKINFVGEIGSSDDVAISKNMKFLKKTHLFLFVICIQYGLPIL